MPHTRPRVGVAVDTVTGFGRQLLRGIMKYASVRRRWLLIKEFLVFETDPRAWPPVDGVIAATSNPKLLQQFQRLCGHVVSCSGSADPALTPVVCMDDQAVGRLAAEHLVDCRLRHFGFYGVRDGTAKLSDNRLAGFRAALALHGFTCDAAPLTYVWKRPLRKGWQDHWPTLIAWVRSLPSPVGILAVDDMAADDLAAACLDAGIPIPDHVALIGVNNDDLLCEGAWPPLSSVQPDYQRVGYTAAKLLDDMMNQGAASGSKDRRPNTRSGRGDGRNPENEVASRTLDNETGEGTVRTTGAHPLITLRPTGVVSRTSTDVLAVDDPQLAAAVRFIREHACGPCSVVDVLRQVPVARRWLEKQFIDKLGRTPHDEITHVRMDTAQRLLLNRELSIEQIAHSVGFSTVQSFNRAFRDATTESPAAYRRARSSKA